MPAAREAYFVVPHPEIDGIFKIAQRTTHKASGKSVMLGRVITKTFTEHTEAIRVCERLNREAHKGFGDKNRKIILGV